MHSPRELFGRGGLRARLALSSAVIVVGALAIVFVAVYRGTGSDLRDRVDAELTQEGRDLARQLGGSDGARGRPSAIRTYIDSQPFTSSSRLLAVTFPGGRVITNEPDLLGIASVRDDDSPADRRSERARGREIATAPPGLRTFAPGADGTGPLRVLTRRVALATGGEADIRVAQSLSSVERAQDGIVRAFLLGGSITLFAALLVGYLLALRTTKPLRRMARTAMVVDSGDLSPRISAVGPHDELRVLADAFDGMLDRLQDAFDRQRAFASDVSHELRTPLTVMRGQLDVLARQEHPGQDDVRHVQRVVTAQVARVEALVEDLLLLARTDEGMPMRAQATAVSRWLADLVDELSLTAERRFEVVCDADGSVRGDRERLTQVLSNLIRNAIEHTADDGLVRVSATPIGVGWLRIAVQDDGGGLPAEQRDRIFDRFHRTDASRSRRSGGAGLGLAIARALVQAHGGQITAGDSDEGGAAFVVELPGYEARRVNGGDGIGAEAGAGTELAPLARPGDGDVG